MAIADSLLGLTPPADDDPSDGSTPSDWRIDLAAYGVEAGLPSGVGYEYLQEVAARPDTTVEPILLLDYSHYEKEQQISPAAMALLSIAVGQWVGNFGFIQGIESAFWQSAAQASLSSVITQTAAGVVSGDLDIGDILEGAAFAGLSAGLTAGINADDLGITFGDGAGVSLLGTGDNFTLAALVEGTIDAGIKAGLTSAVYGTDFGDAFVDSLSATVTSALLADVQTLIGDQGLAEGSAGHAFLHGLAGCGFQEASGGDCAAGFAAGVTGSLYAGYIDQNGLEANLNTAELLGAFAGFVFSSGQGENVSLAGTVSQSGVENNYLTHAQLAQFQEELLACAMDDQACIDAVSDRYLELSLAQNRELIAAIDEIFAGNATAENMAIVQRALDADNGAIADLYMSFGVATGEDSRFNAFHTVFAAGLDIETSVASNNYELLAQAAFIDGLGQVYQSGAISGAELNETLLSYGLQVLGPGAFTPNVAGFLVIGYTAQTLANGRTVVFDSQGRVYTSVEDLPPSAWKAETRTIGEGAIGKVIWIDEGASMSARARSYDDGAMGSRSNIETQKGQAPALSRTTPDGQATTVRFDGVDGNVMIDRKISVVTTQKAKDQVLRQSEALQQNGMTGRWEVPTQAEADRATRMFNELNVTNITVKVVPE
jgi:filamentous hemagglutinin